MWHSGLRIWHCHCNGSGGCCGVGSIPGPGTSTCLKHSQKKKKRPIIICCNICNRPLPFLPCLPGSSEIITTLIATTSVSPTFIFGIASYFLTLIICKPVSNLSYEGGGDLKKSNKHTAFLRKPLERSLPEPRSAHSSLNTDEGCIISTLLQRPLCCLTRPRLPRGVVRAGLPWQGLFLGLSVT